MNVEVNDVSQGTLSCAVLGRTSFDIRTVFGFVDHVITAPSRDGDELNLGRVVSDLLEVDGELRLDNGLLSPGVLHHVGGDGGTYLVLEAFSSVLVSIHVPSPAANQDYVSIVICAVDS